MIGMAVLAVGMTAVTALFHSALLTNNRAKVDTSATMLAQTVLEKIAAQPANQTATIKERFKCKDVEFQVAEKDGKAILKAVPKL